MLLLTALVVAFAGAAVVIAAKPLPGVIGPDNQIQPSGRKLDPVGKLTKLGNLPAGGALTVDGRFAWTLSAGRGKNDVRIVRVLGKRRKQVGKVVQKIPMPGLSGGIAMAPDGKAAYVSGTPQPSSTANRPPADVPGASGDVIHVFNLKKKSGKAKRDGVIEVPPPEGTPPPQSFPPTNTTPLSWPRDVAVSADGTTLLAALNLAHRGAIVDLASREVRYTPAGRYPYGAAITKDGKLGLISNEADGTVTVLDLASGEEVRVITVGPHLSHPEGIAIDPRRPLAYVAVTHQDLIAVINTKRLEVVRTLSVERPQGIGTAPTHVSVTADGCRLISSNSGEDAVAIFALSKQRRCDPAAGKRNGPNRRALADRILDHESRRGIDQAESEKAETAEFFGEEAEEEAEEQVEANPARAKSKRWQLLGRVPVGSYPTAAFATPQKPSRRRLVWVTAKGVGVGPNDAEPGETLEEDPGSATGGSSS